jgi:NitT/TauT family transport system substrate-binding protein
MKKSLTRILIAVVAVVVTAAVVACQAEEKTIRIGFNTWVGYGPFYIAQEKGFFSKRGLNVDLQRIEGTGDRRSALIAGRLEGMGSTVDDLIIGAAQGVEAKMVLALDESAGADGILTEIGVEDVEDFKAKTIAVQPGFVNHFFLLYILDDHGLSSKDVEVKPMEPDKASAAFVAGDVDIAVTWEPHLSQVQDLRPDGKTFLTTNDYPGLIVDILAFNASFIEKQPDDVAAFVDAWYEALEFLKTNPDEANEIIGKAMDLDPVEVADILSGVKFLSPEDNLQYHDPAAAVNVFSIASTASKLWQEEGFIDTAVKAGDLINTDFLKGSE